MIAPLALLACSTVDVADDSDGPGEKISSNSVVDAIPRSEPDSKYGNPESYVVNGKRYTVSKSRVGYVARGIASWYGKKFHGRRTSSGEIFNMYKATAAHRSLPLPPYATVTNLDNGKQVVVKINDRGPFHADRIIDLSGGAAVKIGLASQGTGRVEVRVIDTGGKPSSNTSHTTAVAQPLTASGTYIQVGAFQQFVNAQAMRARTQGAGLLAVSVDEGQTAAGTKLYKVRVGPYVNTARIDGAIAKLRAAGITEFKLITD